MKSIFIFFLIAFSRLSYSECSFQANSLESDSFLEKELASSFSSLVESRDSCKSSKELNQVRELVINLLNNSEDKSYSAPTCENYLLSLTIQKDNSLFQSVGRDNSNIFNMKCDGNKNRGTCIFREFSSELDNWKKKCSSSSNLSLTKGMRNLVGFSENVSNLIISALPQIPEECLSGNNALNSLVSNLETTLYRSNLYSDLSKESLSADSQTLAILKLKKYVDLKSIYIEPSHEKFILCKNEERVRDKLFCSGSSRESKYLSCDDSIDSAREAYNSKFDVPISTDSELGKNYYSKEVDSFSDTFMKESLSLIKSRVNRSIKKVDDKLRDHYKSKYCDKQSFILSSYLRGPFDFAIEDQGDELRKLCFPSNCNLGQTECSEILDSISKESCLNNLSRDILCSESVNGFCAKDRIKHETLKKLVPEFRKAGSQKNSVVSSVRLNEIGLQYFQLNKCKANQKGVNGSKGVEQ